MTYQQIWQRLTPLYEAGEARAITRLVLERLFNMSMTDIVIGKVSELKWNTQAFGRLFSLRHEKSILISPQCLFIGTADTLFIGGLQTLCLRL